MAFTVKTIQTQIIDHALLPQRIIVSNAGRHDRSRFLSVRVETGDGAVGWGEAATTPRWSGESARTAQVMVEELFAPRLTAATFDHPREALEVMDDLAIGNPFAKGALDTAIWDAWARGQGKPALQLFADREPVKWIPTRASVGAYPVEQTLQIAREFWDLGIRTLKFKIGNAGIDDAARLRAVRERLGDAPVFTVDANGAYTSLDGAVRAIEALLPYKLALVEQPVHRDRTHLLAQVRKRIPVPVMADESVFTPMDLAEALDCDAFDVLSVYPGKNGGFTRALEMAQTAAKAGKACAIGSNLETDIGQAAMAALAAGLSAFPVDQIACDLPGIVYYERSSVSAPLQLKDGRIRVPSGHGFGVEPVK